MLMKELSIFSFCFVFSSLAFGQTQSAARISNSTVEHKTPQREVVSNEQQLMSAKKQAIPPKEVVNTNTTNEVNSNNQMGTARMENK